MRDAEHAIESRIHPDQQTIDLVYETAQQLITTHQKMFDSALRGAAISEIVEQTLSCATKLLAGASCAVVLMDGVGRSHTRTSDDFPPALLRQPASASHVASILDMEAGAPAWLCTEPVYVEAQTAAGSVLAYIHTDPGQLAPALVQLAALAKSVGLALTVANRENRSRSAGESFASLAAAIPGVVYQRVVRPNGDIRYLYISESAFELFGVPASEILTNPQALFDRYAADYREGFRERLLEASRTLTPWDVEASIVMADGQRKYTHAIARPARQSDGSVVWTGVIMDATRMKEAEAAVAAAEAQTRSAIVESLSQGLLMFDANDHLTICNSHYRELYPALPGLVGAGATYDAIIRAEAAEALAPLERDCDRRQELQLRLDAHRSDHHVFERQLGDNRWILVNEHRTPDGGTVILYTDVTEFKLRERRIQHIAHHDALTDLPNRVLFRDKLDEALQRGLRSDKPIAVFCLDLDHFKYVNDTLGHPAGDMLLKIVARRVSSCLRACDTVARLGGDEFAVILPELPSVEFATSLAARLLEAVALPADLDGQQVLTAASLGIVLSTPGEEDSARLIKSADLALYRAKADGRNTFRFFEPEMDAKAQARRTLEVDLRMALARDEMELHFQPVVDVYTDEIVAFEALVRWNHPKRGIISPLDFIGLAEETGLIRHLGQWILRRACETAATWPTAVRIAVNLSPAQFKDRELADTVLRILKETGLEPNRLELEITESLLLQDTDANLAVLHRLKAEGIRISMDDFGTGYSSLGNLRSFPFDKIKVDQSFVKDLDRNPDSASIVRAVLSLGRSLGIGTIAEGVETREQLSRLRAEGCTEIQGFYYSKPQPEEVVAKMLIDGLQRRGPKLRSRDDQ